MVTGIQGTDTHRAEIFTILSELYNNAFDHGILGLDSGLKKTSEGFMQYYMEREERMTTLDDARIRLSISHEPYDQGGRLSLSLEDSGKGFDHHNKRIELTNTVEHSGRGIPLVNTLCEELEYQGDGNVVEAKYVWK
jgi:anti-sigma regulatory factor (Ser/Thr protein kinase)